jgi:hypothetical protein
MEARTTVRPQVDPSSADWEHYYAAASKRHRQARREQRHHQVSRKRRRRQERAMMLASVAFVGALTFAFYVVLSR